MRKMLLAVAATAMLAVGSLVPPSAQAMTLPAPAGMAGALDSVSLTDQAHCRRYVHWHRWGYSRGCRVYVVRRHYWRPHYRYWRHRHVHYRRHYIVRRHRGWW
jgi:hypothetical protein